jgi:[histone H3]-lysine36 N-dimethyltransferase SETMAR
MRVKYNGGLSRRVEDIATGDETWLYYYDPKLKRDSKEWVSKTGKRPVNVRAQKSAGKKMFALFFRRAGLVAKVMVPEGCTVNTRWYVRGCLTRVFRKLKKLRPVRGLQGVRLHHDNAPSHTARKAVQFLRKRKIQLTGHSAYSPDLGPLDFFCNPRIKNQLRGIRFSNEKEQRSAVSKAIRSITPA